MSREDRRTGVNRLTSHTLRLTKQEGSTCHLKLENWSKMTVQVILNLLSRAFGQFIVKRGRQQFFPSYMLVVK